MVDDAIIAEANEISALLKQVGCSLASFSPGVRAIHRDPMYGDPAEIYFPDHGTWSLVKEWITELVWLRRVNWEQRQYLDGSDRARLDQVEAALHAVDDAVAQAQAAQAHREALRKRVLHLSAKHRGSEGNAAALLKSIAAWHRASGDSVVSEREADLLDSLSLEFEALILDLFDKQEDR